MKASRWIKCIKKDGNLRAVVIQASDLAAWMARLHGLEGPHAQGLGEAALGGLLVATFCKDGERVNLQIQGKGRFAQALVDAYPDGRVRGYVIPRESGGEGPGLWGHGVLS